MLTEPSSPRIAPRRAHAASQTPAQYALAFFVAVGMGMLRHLIPHWRQMYSASCRAAAAASTSGEEHTAPILPKLHTVAASPLLAAAVDALLYAAAVLMGFLNMLVVMTYNPGLLAAVVIGEVAGLVTWSAASRGRRGRGRGGEAATAPISHGDGEADVEIGSSACH